MDLYDLLPNDFHRLFDQLATRVSCGKRYQKLLDEFLEKDFWFFDEGEMVSWQELWPEHLTEMRERRRRQGVISRVYERLAERSGRREGISCM